MNPLTILYREPTSDRHRTRAPIPPPRAVCAAAADVAGGADELGHGGE